MAKRLLPEAPDPEAFERVVGDDAAFARGVARIVELCGVPARAERFADGSRPVYSLGGELVLKLYAPYDADEAEREALFLDVLDGRLPLLTPKLHAVGELEGWRYVLMGRLRGERLVTAWPSIERAGLRRLARELGEGLRALHAVRDERLERARLDFRALLKKQKAAIVEHHRGRGLGEEWLAQIPAFIEAEWPAIEAASVESALHTEVMREHLYVEKTDVWRISGLFDFEPAMVGAAEYEFGAVGVFFSCGDCELFRDVLRAYGYGAIDHSLARRLLAYKLLHRYSNLAWYLRHAPPPKGATRLDDLASHFFGA